MEVGKLWRSGSYGGREASAGQVAHRAWRIELELRCLEADEPMAHC